MMEIPTREAMREALVERESEELVHIFETSKVAICGLGGLGSNIAISLARAGVGSLHLIDFDKVDLSNMNRQQYGVKHLGRPKTECLQEIIKEIAPYCKVKISTTLVTQNNIQELLMEDEVVCEAFDVAEHKATLVNGVLEFFPDKYLVAASGMAGMGDGNEIKTKKITEHFFLCGDGHSEVARENSLVAPRVMLCAAHQGLCVLQILQQRGKKE